MRLADFVRTSVGIFSVKTAEIDASFRKLHFSKGASGFEGAPCRQNLEPDRNSVLDCDPGNLGR